MSEQRTPLVGSAARGRWYDAGGPVDAVPDGGGGRMVPPALAHARALGLLPGVGRIVSMIPRGRAEGAARERWALAAAFTRRSLDEPEAAWLDRVGLQADLIDRRAAFALSVRDEAVCHLDARLRRSAHTPEPAAAPACEWTARLVERARADCGYFNLCAGRAFADFSRGYGGTVDGYLESARHIWYIAFAPEESRESDSAPHLARLLAWADATAAWSEAGCSKTVHPVTLFISAPDGETRPCDWSENPDYHALARRARRSFAAARELWCALRDYDPLNPPHFIRTLDLS